MRARYRCFLVVLVVLTSAACDPSTTQAPAPSSQPLDADQTLSFPIAQDLADLDPALVSNPSDVDILRNVFSGLYKFDDHLREVPDLASGPAQLSSDGRTYTFRLRTDLEFSNGDPVTARDVVYSWNRAAARQGDYASLFGLIDGYAAVASGAAITMRGLRVVDDLTFEVALSRPAGYFLSEVATWPFWVVDRRVIESAGEDAWATKAATLVGTGPFRMTARTPGASMEFAPVAGWYGGSTGALTRVEVVVLADAAAQADRYASGVFGVIGYARQAIPTANVKDKPLVVPLGVTFWAGFNMRSGAFAGDAGRPGRHAFSSAIDRKSLAAAVCDAGTTCAPATGGLISKGLAGYLGDGADASAKFDAAGARAEYAAWDPTGSKVRGLAYTYDSNPFNKRVCANLKAQWKANLGVDVACVEVDRKTFLDRRNGACAYPLFRGAWAADYDHPADWFDHLFASGASSSGACYANATLDRLVASADAGSLDRGLVDYRASGALLVQASVIAPLLYGLQPYLIHSYVKGAGGNALYDFSWTAIQIVRH